MNISDTLFIIPARGGSKGLPRKNILPLGGKPMIYYTIDAARSLTTDDNICVTTEDTEIKEIVEEYGLKVPFLRPAELATDYSSSREVVLHATKFYREKLGKQFEKICLLQPTSPLRTAEHILEAYSLWNENLDMVVSVKESKANPYFNLFEEEKNGLLRKSKEGNFTRRQDAPKTWEFNGAIYIFTPDKILNKPFSEFQFIRKYVMNEKDSLDVDNQFDFTLVEYNLQMKYTIKNN